jgi:Uma2 family endonuclease
MQPAKAEGRMGSMADLQTRPRKTVEDFMKLPEGTLAELIDGEIFMSAAPRMPHQGVILNLAFAFKAFADRGRSGRVVLSPMDVHLPTGDIVEPDLIFVRQENIAIIQDWVRGAPDLLVEVLSPSHPERDLIVKRDLYARNGVGEYWIVDPADRSVQILRLVLGRYEPAGYRRGNQTLGTVFMPGFELAVEKLFE